MTGVGFEPTSTNTSELESDPLDHSGNQSHFTINYYNIMV